MLREFKEDTYIIIYRSDLSSVNFDQIKQDSVYTCRYSLDKDQVVLSYKNTPEFILVGKLKPIKYLTWSQAIVEMELDTWSQTPIEDE